MHQSGLKIDILEVQVKIVIKRGRTKERAREELFSIQFRSGN